MLVEVLDALGRVQWRERLTGAGSTCRLGRHLGCDVVVDDPFAAPEHALLTLLADGRVHVQDLGTRNGVLLNGSRIAADGVTIDEGELIIGRTPVRIRTAHAGTAPEREVSGKSRRRSSTALAVFGSLALLCHAAFRLWLDIPERPALMMLIAVLVVAAATALWVGVWSLITHLNHGSWQVRTHVAIATNGVALCAWGYWLYQLGAFATQWRSLAPLMLPLGGAIVLLMMYQHLHRATRMSSRVALLLAAIAAGVLAGSTWIANLYVDARDVNRIVHGPAIQPPALRLAPSTDIADYLTDVEDLQREANRNRQESLARSPLLDEVP